MQISAEQGSAEQGSAEQGSAERSSAEQGDGMMLGGAALALPSDPLRALVTVSGCTVRPRVAAGSHPAPRATASTSCALIDPYAVGPVRDERYGTRAIQLGRGGALIDPCAVGPWVRLVRPATRMSIDPVGVYAVVARVCGRSAQSARCVHALEQGQTWHGLSAVRMRRGLHDENVGWHTRAPEGAVPLPPVVSDCLRLCCRLAPAQPRHNEMVCSACPGQSRLCPRSPTPPPPL